MDKTDELFENLAKKRKSNFKDEYCHVVEYLNQLDLLVQELEDCGEGVTIFDSKKIISNISQQLNHSKENTIEIIQYKSLTPCLLADISSSVVPILFLSDKSGKDLFNEPLVCYFAQKIVFKLWILDEKKNDFFNMLCEIIELAQLRNEECFLLIRNIVKYLRKSQYGFDSDVLFRLVIIITDRLVEIYKNNPSDTFSLLFACNDMVYNYIKLLKDNLSELVASRILSYSIIMLESNGARLDVNSKKLFSIIRKVVETCSYDFFHQLGPLITHYPTLFSSEYVEIDFCSERVESSVQREFLLLIVKLAEKCNKFSHCESIWFQADLKGILETSEDVFYKTIQRICSIHDVSLLQIFLSLFRIQSNWKKVYPHDDADENINIADDLIVQERRRRINSFMNNVLNPHTIVYHLMQMLNFNVQIMMNYLISDETCEYILELIFKMCRWYQQENVMNNNTLLTEYEHEQIEEGSKRHQLVVVVYMMNNLHLEIYQLHTKGLFPYDANTLLNRLLVFGK